ncbi:hypothetical protein SAV31267_040820 [Streptomyces avermitilis]|uniref:Integral membrane protein n=2 Tax=Streptomyces TaxID=1883 RepID=A0A4D4MTZ4_STRAX|nr:hypothetical protein SAVMC3_58040 [Streptomyces avermitilis]GDY74597.1 hypothetical protein SAV31267_040820 [Streptomyces avermitilis]
MRVAVRASLGAVRTSLWAAVPLLVVLLLLVIVRLPWNGDLGMHAATVERLRHHLLDPGNPLVDADTPSPYYSPWTVLLGCVAKVTGLSVFVVLRLGAVVGLGLLVTGIWRYARTLSGHRFAPPLAVLCVLFLWGTQLFNWSGFLGLNSLALTVAYPSVFALGLAFHFWALLTRALKASPDAGWEVYLGLGLLWAVILLSHQFTGVVASLGALATVIGARVGRHVWLRLGAAAAVGVLLLVVWPYYDFFALFRVGGLEDIHRALYRDLLARYGLALVGVVALGVRARRDPRDPLVVFFLLGAAVFALGGLTGHYSWGRVLPAALIPAQVAAAVEVAGASRGAVRAAGRWCSPALWPWGCGRRSGRWGTWWGGGRCRRRWRRSTGSPGRGTTGSRRGCGTGMWCWPRRFRPGRSRRTGRTRWLPGIRTSSCPTRPGGRPRCGGTSPRGRPGTSGWGCCGSTGCGGWCSGPGTGDSRPAGVRGCGGWPRGRADRCSTRWCDDAAAKPLKG